MIKKSVFEDEIVAGMHQRLVKQASQRDMTHLEKAADYLNSAAEIFEDLGMRKNADEVVSILAKIAAPLTEAAMMPSMEDWKNAGISMEDLKSFKSNPISKAKINVALRDMGYNDHQLVKLLGHAHVMSEKEARELVDPKRSFMKMWEWMEQPKSPVDPEDIKPGEEISFKSMADHKHSDPSSGHNGHTKGLTSDKMLKNLSEHGIVFNIFDDVSNLDIDDTLEVSDNETPKDIHDFEDERD